MNGYCKVTVVGNLTRDVELRYLQNGTAVAEATVAVNRTWKDEQGAKHEEVSFIDCTLWSRAAETAAQYIKKGFPVLFDGRLKQESWEDKQTGQKRSRLRVVVETMLFLPNGKEGASQAPASAPASQAPPPTAREQARANSVENESAEPEKDDLPF